MDQVAFDFGDVVRGIATLYAKRDALVAQGFDQLHVDSPALAQLLLASSGNRRRAAHWLCLHHPALGGRSSWEAIADGDVDMVWDLLLKGLER